tara:strand:- start:400 stop:1452 length:1053 start_codon:yes stop_codon:yes gene_type:complete
MRSSIIPVLSLRINLLYIHTVKQRIPGLLSVALLAAASYGLMTIPSLSQLGISPLVIAIILGITVGNIIPLHKVLTPGIQFSAKQVLRTAIILYGFRVSLQEISTVGLPALLIDVSVVTLTLLLGYQIGKRVFKLDSDLSLLISAGAAICGAAAVLAVEDVIKSEPYKATVAVGTVVLFGTLSMFLYPAMHHAGWLGLTDTQFGVFAGASVHEVAQALVAGSNISPAVGETAVVVKMIRVLMLVPVLFLLSAWKTRQSAQQGRHRQKIMIPWFAIGFLLVIIFNSFHWLPSPWVGNINQVDLLLLTMAMGAIGLETKISKIRKVGLNPLYLAVMLFVWLLCFGMFAVKHS